MSRRQNDGTFRCQENLTKDEGNHILKQHDQEHNETCPEMFTLSKRKTKQKTRNRTRNRKTRESLERSINWSYYQTIKVQRKGLDIDDKELM